MRDDGNRHDRDDNGVHDLLDSDDDNTDVRDRGTATMATTEGITARPS